MRVGVNYPWFDYGWDFGEAPPGWRQGEPRWQASIDADLSRLVDLGVEVVRWFILADGLAYGTGATAPRIDAASASGWSFDPPPLDDLVVRHFEALLRHFDCAPARDGRALQLIPVFVDFKFCEPGSRLEGCAGWIKGGRAAALADAAARGRFLDHALEPLLEASRRHAAAIYAWEIVNEPEWVTAGWGPHRRPGAPVPEQAMRAFLREASERIGAAGFEPTVGYASDRGRRQAGIPTGIEQVHHYPAGMRALPGRGRGSRARAVLGEFATTAEDVWPDLPRADQTPIGRLRRAMSLGYELAMPWSFRARDRHSSWTPAVEDDLRRFTQESKRG